MFVYVDNIIIPWNSEPRIKSLINKFNDQFSLKHRVISRYISLPLCRCLTFPFTSQVYKRLICKSQFSRSQRNAYSYDLKFKTFKSWLIDYLHDPTFYRLIVGALQYATITTLETGFVLNKTCQFLSQPLESHWTRVKRILWYLKGSLYHGLLLKSISILIPLYQSILWCSLGCWPLWHKVYFWLLHISRHKRKVHKSCQH